MMLFRVFGLSFAVTGVGLVAGFLYGGLTGFVTVAILAVLEISLSFDNAVVNARVLGKMSVFWQKIFLTIGVLIAVFGMRLLFPIVIVSVTAGLDPLQAWDLALTDKAQYQHRLEDAHPAIAAFGGMFLLMLFLDYIFEEHEHRWLGAVERGLAKVGKLDTVSVIVSLTLLLVAANTFVNDSDVSRVMISGAAGICTYLLVNALASFFEDDEDAESGDLSTSTPTSAKTLVAATGKAAFFLFLYLELIDASFSFDGVIGAFAISSDIIIIAIGLGVGAMYIRSCTVWLVRKGTLSEYIYLEHGAHWAIGALALLLLASTNKSLHAPEWVTGLIGVGFIAAAFVSSVRHRRSVSATDSDSSDTQAELADSHKS